MRGIVVNRRSFLSTLAVAGVARARPAGAAELPHPRGARLGLELYSLRNELKKDLAGTLAMAHAWGFDQVEVAGFPQMRAQETAHALQRAGLHAVSAFFEYERLRDDFGGIVREARTLGLDFLICGWIPHDQMLTSGDVDRAVASFNTWGAEASRQSLRLGYHIHGYEFVASDDGTLLDTLITRTDPAHVSYEMDVFWVVRGGGDPVALLQRYGDRIRLVHLKDMRRGTPTGILTGEAPDDASVAIGTGIVDWPAVMKAAVAAKVKWYLIEDEHPDAVTQIPHSLEYLRRLKI